MKNRFKRDIYKINRQYIKKIFPIRKNHKNTNKEKFGHAVIIAGSVGFDGASILVAEAAMRSGAGQVTLMVPENLQPQIISMISPVIMTVGVKYDELDSILKAVESATAVALGPGLGHNDQLSIFLRGFISQCPVPLVIDADGLNFLSSESDRGESLIKARHAPTILTPHPGELARLLDVDVEDIQFYQKESLQEALQNYECTVILKGKQTLVSSLQNSIYKNSTGHAGLSTAGTGDVLTGILVSLLGQKLSPLKASIIGTYLHGLSAEIASKYIGGQTGLIATDVIDFLPRAISKCQS